MEKGKIIIAMVASWESEGRAFSHINFDDSAFFKAIGKDISSVGITSQTGNDIVYYRTDWYFSDTNALRKIRSSHVSNEE